MGNTYRILLVEDSETQVQRLQFLFAEQGWQTEKASTEDEALNLLAQTLPDLIILNHHLAGANGTALCGLIRRKCGSWNPPILMFTAQDSPASGADDYLRKPVDDTVLLLRVRTLLRQSQTNRSTLSSLWQKSREPGNAGETACATKADQQFAKRVGQAFASAPADAAKAQARILAVDADRAYLEYLVRELQGDGYAVEGAPNGAEALDRIKVRGYDCVLLDLGMPHMDGIEVCRAISASNGDLPRHPVILMLTAYENPAEMASALESGADDFVRKSRDVTVLKSRLRALLRRKLRQDSLKDKELEILRAHVAREAAEMKAALTSQISEKNRELEESNRKLTETQMHLVHSANMASLGQLVAGIAHEINNPIAFVDNNCFLIKEKLEDLALRCEATLSPANMKLIASGQERLSETRMGLQRVKDLIGKLRTFSRLDEGEFKPTNVPESIDSVLLLLHHRNRKIQIDRQFANEAMLDCAPGQLNQVLMNVLANATDAIDEQDGRITVRTEVQEGWYCISVRDSGPGVPVSIQSRLFQPFFTTKPVGKGTGLGLAISHSIIQAHKGQIEVLSPEGGGAEVRIRIPLDLKGNI